jgi:hypothetical protein
MPAMVVESLQKTVVRIMRADKIVTAGLVAVFGLVFPGSGLGGQQGTAVERVTAKGGKTLAVQAGLLAALERELAFPQGIKVMTNATFRVGQGKERKLLEGQVLGADGLLISPDGAILPVVDHAAMEKGQVIVSRDGERSPLQGELRLGDGSILTADGYRVVTDRARTKTKLLDGQMFKLDGQEVPATDTVTLRNGKVWVQKDGSRLEVPAGRSLMMNDGTKVFGDGQIVMKDGKTRRLAEGEILTVAGVTRR